MINKNEHKYNMGWRLEAVNIALEIFQVQGIKVVADLHSK